MGKLRREYQTRRKGIIRFAAYKLIMRREFERAAHEPLQEDKVVFLELRLPAVSNSYREIFNQLVRDYQLNIHCHFLRTGFVTQEERWKRIFDFARDAATAKYLIYDEGSEIIGALPKRKGQKILNTWHGAGAFKRFGYSTADKIFGADPDTMSKYPPHADYDLVTVSSPEVVWAYAEAMGKEDNPACIQPIGCSRTDVFYQQDFIDAARKRLYARLPQARGKKIILYAPTFRGHVAEATTPDLLDIEEFQKRLGGEYLLVIKHHPVVKERPAIPDSCRDFAFDLSDGVTIEDLLCVADICISDYSSLIFEYALFEKPMVFFAYDLDDFFDWRGFYYDYDELAPGPICQTNAEMIDYIAHIDERFDHARVHAFREKFMSACDGHATERIMTAFFDGALEPYRRKMALSGSFGDIPDSTLDFARYALLLDYLQTIKEIARRAYQAGCGSAPIKGTVALVCDEHVPAAFFNSLRAAYAKDKRGLTLIDDREITPENVADFAAELALCESIICAGEPYLIRMLDMRPETRLIQACPSVLPLRAEGTQTREARSGYYLELLRVAPHIPHYDAIMATAPTLEAAYRANYPLRDAGDGWSGGCNGGMRRAGAATESESNTECKDAAEHKGDIGCQGSMERAGAAEHKDGDSSMRREDVARQADGLLYLGNLGTDLLFNKRFVKKATRHLDELCPQRRGRKTVLVLCHHDNQTLEQAVGLFRFLHEELVEDHFLIFDDYDARSDSWGDAPSYLSSFVVNTRTIATRAQEENDAMAEWDPAAAAAITVPKPLELYEELALADIVISDGRPEAFTLAAAGRQIVVWNAGYGADDDTLVDCRTLLPGAVCNSPEEILALVKDSARASKAQDSGAAMSAGPKDAAMQESAASQGENAGLQEENAAFAREYLAGCDGRTASRLLDWLRDNPA